MSTSPENRQVRPEELGALFRLTSPGVDEIGFMVGELRTLFSYVNQHQRGFRGLTEYQFDSGTGEMESMSRT